MSALDWFLVGFNCGTILQLGVYYLGRWYLYGGKE